MAEKLGFADCLRLFNILFCEFFQFFLEKYWTILLFYEKIKYM